MKPFTNFCIVFNPLATEVSDYAAGKEVIVSGWGSTNNDNAFPDYLQVAQVPIIADSYCKRRDVYGNGISYSMVCAGKLGRVDSCSGTLSNSYVNCLIALQHVHIYR